MDEGVLNLDKPRGPTSHDVVNRVRALVGLRQVGHAGTLDPMATGVLLVCVGRATRLAEYLVTGRKVYRAVVRLGVETDTHDAEGSVVAEAPLTVGCADVEQALAGFRGRISQVPPAFSAVKHQGTPLYKLARRGIEVEREARQVEVFDLRLLDCQLPDCVLEVTCSPGTYVRVLAHDLGRTLGCGAHLTSLTRLASGGFRLQDALSLEKLEQATGEGWRRWLCPMDKAIAHFPALHLDQDAAQRLCSGRAVAGLGQPPMDATGAHSILARAYGPTGDFLAVARYEEQTGLWRPRKVFCSVER